MTQPIQIYITDSLIGLKPSSIVAYKTATDIKFKLIVTNKNGAIVELDSISNSGISSLINTDGFLSITGTATKTINLSNSLFAEIQNKIEGELHLQKVSAEPIPSYTPIAIYNNLAYKLDASNSLHQFAFVGFSTNGTTTGQICKIQQFGELELLGWGLTPNTQYLAGTRGVIVSNNIISLNFTKVIGYATTSNTLQIIKDYTTINK